MGLTGLNDLKYTGFITSNNKFETYLDKKGRTWYKFTLTKNQGGDLGFAFWNCTCNESTAKLIQKFLAPKGSLTVSCELVQENYTDKEGKNRVGVTFQVNGVSIHDWKPKDQQVDQPQMVQNQGMQDPTQQQNFGQAPMNQQNYNQPNVANPNYAQQAQPNYAQQGNPNYANQAQPNYANQGQQVYNPQGYPAQAPMAAQQPQTVDITESQALPFY